MSVFPVDTNDPWRAIADESVRLARTWAHGALTTKPSSSAALLGRLLKDPEGLEFALAFVDRVVRPEDVRVAARSLAQITRKPPAFLPLPLRLAARAGTLAPLMPRIAVPAARAVLRKMVSHLVIDARPARLGKAIEALRADGTRLNVNLLGEAVLGKAEAARRLAGTRALLERDDVDYISIKVSSVVAQLSMWAFDEMVDQIVATLTPLFETAAAAPTPKFINLDMEEYRDLDLTIATFIRILDQPKLRKLSAGIVLQAYLPDALAALDRLTAWATARVDDGGAPIKIRVVKGANLAMERVDATMHGWPQAPYAAKVGTDANYKRVLARALAPARTRAVRVGVAGHNLFDLAFAHLLAVRADVPAEDVDYEMLLGMAEGQASLIRATVGELLLYVPVVRPAEFDVAISYLVRRLEENAADENFMSAVFDLGNPEMFNRERDRFLAAVRLIDAEDPQPNRTQSRLAEEVATEAPPPLDPDWFENTPDTDPALADNRAWGRARLAAARTSDLGRTATAAAMLHTAEAIDDAVATGRAAGQRWAGLPATEHARILHRAGQALAAHRGDLVEVMAAEAGKTIAEADPEVSEATDFAHYYATRALELEDVDGATFTPARLTVVTPPWNFPVAIPAGSTLAALAAGSAVIIKPATPARRCGAVLVEALWDAGVPRDVLQLVNVADHDLGEHLVAHDGVDRVILTGSIETAAMFRSWRPDLPLLAETSGKNAIIVTPSADLDLAVADVVKSAFGHAGQKCSAGSLVILVGAVGTSQRFERQLIDAISTLRVGLATEPETTMGPVIDTAGGKLLRGLTKLGPGEKWLLEPKQLDDAGRLWSPGLRTGVRPGSDYHRTEFFGPILGIMRAATLDEAIEWANGTDYGLTAGLHTLDPAELATWLDGIQAGNLYVNRGVTGAIVRRQPFGGWKLSSVGGGAKAGGPSYLLGFGTWAPAPLPPRTATLDPGVEALLTATAGVIDAEAVRAAAVDDQLWWEREYGVVKDVTGLGVERNLLRYLPTPVTIRLAAGGSVPDVVRQVAASLRAGAEATVSTADALPARVAEAFRAAGISLFEAQDDDAFAAMVREGDPTGQRVRIVQAPGDDAARRLAHAVGGDPAVAIIAGPSTPSGRIELLTYLREQAVAITAHRFGEPDDWSESVI